MVTDIQKEKTNIKSNRQLPQINESNKNKTRNCNVDLMRIIACCIVIGVHINIFKVTNIDNSRILYGILLGDGVTIFFAIMGFFLFKNKSFKILLQKTFFRIIIPFFATILASEILSPWIFNKTNFVNCITNIHINLDNIIRIIFTWHISRNTYWSSVVYHSIFSNYTNVSIIAPNC